MRIICPTCDGRGKHSRHLGAMSAEEFCEQYDPDERDAYFAGEYDRRCETCNGTGKIREDEMYRHQEAVDRERGYNDAGEPLW